MSGMTKGSGRFLALRRRTLRLLTISLLGIVAGTPAHAQTQSGTYGDWVFGIDTELTAASTEAADGTRFGIVCSLNCLAYVESDLTCREDASYMGTAESTLHGFDIQWRCRHLQGRSVLVAPASEQLITVIAECDEITFSIMLEGETSNRLHFSLNGAHQAVTTALEAAIPIAERLQAARTDPTS